MIVIVQYWQRWSAEGLLYLGLHSVPAQECQSGSCYVRSSSCGKLLIINLLFPFQFNKLPLSEGRLVNGEGGIVDTEGNETILRKAS